ncbi:MAG: uracil-DNA glycosylase family protein [Calditrichaeota bacterium]|nr:MAG: uracil-DNA glycosylase family protein [Calditrichota bacterium]
MIDLLNEIRACDVCKGALPHAPRPVIDASLQSKIIIIGQAPGRKVHLSGIPWDDASGQRLREWMGISTERFYNTAHIAIIPMGFCYPGKGASGDLPPRKECAPLWHTQLLQLLTQQKLTLLIGQHAQKYYLGGKQKKNLTETVRNYMDYLPDFLPLPHPSPRNRFWLQKNPWFEKNLLPELKKSIAEILGDKS